MLPKYRRPKENEIQACSQYLDKEIELINPEVIVPLGYYSTRYIFEKYKMPLPNCKSEFSKVYAKLYLSEGRKILPLQHPAALLYNEGIKEEMIKNYSKLKTLMKD
jgi:DNA polymerase